MKKVYSLFAAAAMVMIVMAGFGCSSNNSTPRGLLEKYFSSAQKQDYATTYSCYYDAYKAKVDRDEFVKHRKEASVLQSYQIVSLNQDGDKALAEVRLTFAPSEKLKRTEPVSTRVREDLVKERGEWKIKVW
jgi:hypothetical protein